MFLNLNELVSFLEKLCCFYRVLATPCYCLSSLSSTVTKYLPIHIVISCSTTAILSLYISSFFWFCREHCIIAQRGFLYLIITNIILLILTNILISVARKRLAVVKVRIAVHATAAFETEETVAVR